MSIKLKRALFVSLFAIFISVYVIKIYEPVSTENTGVNILKRMAAETGAFIINIYDPYKNGVKAVLLSPQLSLKGEGIIKTGEDFLRLIEEEKNLKGHLKIVEYNNKPIIQSRFLFGYQTFEEPKLKILREKYNLQDVIKQGETEFQQILLLKDWVNKRWRIGKPENVSHNFDALDILNRAEKGERFFCSEYATTYVQMLAAFGITARYIGLFKGHIVAEVWSNEFDKWIVMDPHFNIHYEQSGIPLDALQLHNAWINNNWRDIKIVRGVAQTIDDTIDNYQFKLIDYYENFYIRMRNDWLTNQYPHWYPKANSIMNGIEWSDKYTKNDIRVARESNRVEDLYWQLNHVYIELTNYNVLDDTIKLRIYLDTITPNFDKFLIMIDENEIINTVQSNFDWKLHKGLNTIEIASLNKADIKGPPAIISINYI